MLKEAFRFPQHNEKLGCCFKCRVCPYGIRDTSSAAPWHTQRLGHWDLLQRLIEQGKGVSPIFSAPGVTTDIVKIDWMHIVELVG